MSHNKNVSFACFTVAYFDCNGMFFLSGTLSCVALTATPRNIPSFLLSVIVRRELSMNFCFYNEHYDSFDGLPAWAKKTLKDHLKDPRDFIYTRDQFEKSQTHDVIWNAAQNEMVQTGKSAFISVYA